MDKPTTHLKDGIAYFIRGIHPKLLILSGTHGDEYEVTEHVTRFIDTHQKDIPDYLYIPEVSPSAIAQKTRRNKYDHDMNREFINTSADPEVIANMEIINPFIFDLCIAFHEDPDRTKSFYIYDSHHFSEAQMSEYRKYILATGASLYTGVDDPADPHLALHIEQGFVSTPIVGNSETGFSMRWLIENHIASRVLNPEIPGKADKELKSKLVEAVFQFSLTLLS